MRKLISILLGLFAAFNISATTGPEVHFEKDDIYKEINDARSNPVVYDYHVQEMIDSWDLKPGDELFDYASNYSLSELNSTHRLLVDLEVEKVAQERAEELAASEKLSHRDRKGRTANYYLHKSGIKGPQIYPNTSAFEACQATKNFERNPVNFFMFSEDHRKVLRDEYAKSNVMGVGIAKGSSGKVYICVLVVDRTNIDKKKIREV